MDIVSVDEIGGSASGATETPFSAGLERADLNREAKALIAEGRLRWKAHVDGAPIERLVRALVGEAGDLTDIGLMRKLADRLDEARSELYDLRYAITGGEDVPGYLMSLPHEQIIEIAREQHRSTGEWIDRVNRMGAALDEIASSHLPDQPAAFDMPDYDWAIRHIRHLRKLALDGLGCELGLYTRPAESDADSPSAASTGNAGLDTK